MIFQSFKIKELFYIHPTKSYNLTNSQLFCNDGKVPVVTNTSENYGRSGFSNLKPTEHDIITFSDTGTKSPESFFFQEGEFIGYAHVQGMYPYSTKWGKKQLIYLTTILRKKTHGLYDYSTKMTREIISNLDIELPIINGTTDQIDFNYMETYIDKITQEQVNKLDTYLRISGLNSFKLTDADRYILSLNKEYKEYKITDIFNIVNTHSILQSQINENSGGTPYLTAAEGNNSVSTYISCDDKWIDEGNCIFIGGKTMTITYQEKDFFSNDSHNLALYLKDNSKRNKYIQCFFITALKKSLGTKYYWGDSISKKKIQNDTVFLPINDKMEIDYDYMKSYIKVIEKIVISDVVKYKDSLNTASDITSD